MSGSPLLEMKDKVFGGLEVGDLIQGAIFLKGLPEKTQIDCKVTEKLRGYLRFPKHKAEGIAVTFECRWRGVLLAEVEVGVSNDGHHHYVKEV